MVTMAIPRVRADLVSRLEPLGVAGGGQDHIGRLAHNQRWHVVPNRSGYSRQPSIFLSHGSLGTIWK